MKKRTTIEIDERLLERAKRALGASTTRATVEEALRLAADNAEADQARRATNQRRYFERLEERVDMSVLASDEMWR
jgi:Arc/MetJ family transcription regulator